MNYLQQQESFSSSKTGLSSDDEDGGADGPRTSNHQQNDYFEISLPPSLPPPPSSITKTIHEDTKEEEFEFCFSFNSNSNLLDFPTTPVSGSSDHPFHHREPPIATSAMLTSSHVVNIVNRKYNHHKKINNSVHYKRIFQKASSPRCHHGSISPYVMPASRLRTFDKTHRELVKNRTSAKLGGIRKFMVKLRSIKRMLRSSLKQLPLRKVNQTNAVNQKLRVNCTHTTINSEDNMNFVTNSQSQNRNQEAKKSSRMINFNKMFDVIMKNIRTSRRSKQTDSKSCPESIKSSPMHDASVGNARDHERRNSFYSRDHSIQSAIAHCNKSFSK